ncbi:hypothetical protein B0T24DRAFT_29780 [Lasiosphaeria ovina]|uniref:Uncharacterized protein n=1 Tax=Lasiosphaeria ovina TaxID=92902 RepID=A0AAE0TXE9_9PEZI|nr:hypothetical protein B0T24DRAFT_29780 [Lasiosphaeria ovina]
MSIIRGLLPLFLFSLALSSLGRVAGLPKDVDNDRSGSATAIAFGDIGLAKSWIDPIPGTKPLFGFKEPVLELSKRDCLANGSNFCFDDKTKFCPNCGLCCLDTGICCSGGSSCCGTGCCTSGQTCSQGQCIDVSTSVAVVTVVSTIYQTVSHTATQTATVLVNQIDTSTVVSTVEVTVSSAATQTNVVWATVTAVAKRGGPGPDPHPYKAREAGVRHIRPDPPQHPHRGFLRSLWADIASRGLASVGIRLDHAIEDVLPVRRDASSTSYITSLVTQTTDVTNFVSTTVTAFTTSLVVTTVFRTITRVLTAQTTIDVTSTLTITSHQPSTVITTATPTLPPTFPTTRTTTDPATSSSAAPALPASSSSSPGSALSTSAIAAIGVGGGILAVLVVALAIFFFRRHRRRSRPFLTTNSSSILPPPENSYIREPTLPTIPPQFLPSPPEHHAAQFLHPGAQGGGGGGGGGNHQRSSSGFTTLLGTPSPTAKKGDRQSALTTGSGATAVAEAQGSPPPEWYEVDGSNPVAAPPGAAGHWGAPQQQHYRQGSYDDHPADRQPSPPLQGPGQGFYHAEELEASQRANELDASHETGLAPAPLGFSQQQRQPEEVWHGPEQQPRHELPDPAGYDGGYYYHAR